ncbi:tyrosine-type recombinase/integrase [Neomoorella humiferrea]|uniref:tyrosine-type recombinase/integrase n=1 Tax=Neomoorella humiferrea TaxID=676965 RepID=UPI003D93F1B8
MEGLPNPAEGLQIPVPKRIVKKDILSPAEFAKLLASAEATGYPQLARAIVTALYGTGIRVSELINLPLVNDLENRQALLVFSPKNKKEYLVPLLPEVRTSISAYIKGERRLVPVNPKTESLLFLTPKGKKLSGQWIYELLATLCAKAGIQKKITSHCLRHSFATNLWKNSADIAEIKELLNHAYISTTQIYVHTLLEANIRKVICDNPLVKIVENFWSQNGP